MPVYQYACTDCGSRLEVRQSFTDDALTVCPQCEGRLRKVLSAVGVVFKGSGFYRTDSRKSAVSSEGSGNGSSTPSTTTPAKEGSSSPPSSGTSTPSTAGSTGSAAKAAN